MFLLQRYLPDSLGVNLFNAYYPVIISGFSLIICFWAEVSPQISKKIFLISIKLAGIFGMPFFEMQCINKNSRPLIIHVLSPEILF